MNLQRKFEIQGRRIIALQKQIEELTKENATLRSKNQELLDKESQYQNQIDMIEELRREFTDGLAEINTIKGQYQQATYEARQIKREFTKKFKLFIKQLKSID